MPYINKNPNEDFIFFLKVLIFTLLAFYLLFGLTKVAFGATYEDWLTNPLGSGENYHWIAVEEFDVLVDNNGYSYWKAGEAPATLQLIPYDNWQDAPVFYYPDDGYYLWIFGTKSTGTDNYFRFTDYTSTARYSSQATIMSEFSVDGRTITSRRWLGIIGDYEAPYKNINIDAPKINNGEIYAILYTDDDLSYIDTEAELYDLIEEHVVSNDINFTEPTGQQEGTAPFYLDVEGDYEIASSTIYWTDIEVEMTFYSPPDYATSSIDTKYIALPNAQNKGTGNFSDEDNALYWSVINGTYVYRARFIESYYGYVIETSEWFYNEGAYWLFEVGEEGGGLPSMEDYFATTTDFGLLGNMFRDVLLWLFKPSTQVLEYWYSIKDMVADKPPFGYYALIKDAFDELSSEAAPAFSLQTATSTATFIFTPLKTGLAWIFWILFGVWFIKRFVHFVV